MAGFIPVHRQLEQILPDLEDMANNPDLLDQLRQRRFNNDDNDDPPPPYRSSSPSEIDPNDPAAPIVSLTDRHRDSLMAEIEEQLAEPLTEEEMRYSCVWMEQRSAAYSPGKRYEDEAEQDWFNLLRYARERQKYYKLLRGKHGILRGNVYARCRIRRKWQKLGIWNPSWGIPVWLHLGEGYPYQEEGPRRPEDEPENWKWKWQGDTPTKMTRVRGVDETNHPNWRAVCLRRGLPRGHHEPVLPRSHLGENPSKSEAEAFITSRPYYIWGLEVQEELVRLSRLPYNKTRVYEMRPEEHVAPRWTAAEKKALRTWKWPHESPPPTDDEDISDIEMTPSEIDALDAIPPSPEPEPWKGPIPVGGLFGAPLPVKDESVADDEDREQQEPQAQEPEHEPEHEPGHEPQPEPEPEPEPEPQRRRGRPRKAKAVPNQVEAPAPRRSARIAALQQASQLKTGLQNGREKAHNTRGKTVQKTQKTQKTPQTRATRHSRRLEAPVKRRRGRPRRN